MAIVAATFPRDVPEPKTGRRPIEVGVEDVPGVARVGRDEAGRARATRARGAGTSSGISRIKRCLLEVECILP